MDTCVIPPDYRFTARQLEYVQLRRQGWTLAKIAEQCGVTKQAVSVVLRRIGVPASVIHDHPTRKVRSDRRRPVSSLRRRRRRRVSFSAPERPRARCLHCGTVLSFPARAGNKPSFCGSNERGCRTAYRRLTHRLDAGRREAAYARTRLWYRRRKLGVAADSGFTLEHWPVQRCAFCDVALPKYRPGRLVRSCATKRCRNQYYRAMRQQHMLQVAARSTEPSLRSS